MASHGDSEEEVREPRWIREETGCETKGLSRPAATQTTETPSSKEALKVRQSTRLGIDSRRDHTPKEGVQPLPEKAG